MVVSTERGVEGATGCARGVHRTGVGKGDPIGRNAGVRFPSKNGAMETPRATIGVVSLTGSDAGVAAGAPVAGSGLPMLVRLLLVLLFLALFVGVLVVALPLALILFACVSLLVLVNRAWGAMTRKAERLAKQVGLERADREGRRNVEVVERGPGRR